MPVPAKGQVLPPDVLNTHSAWVKASNEIAGLMLVTMDPDIQKNLEQLGAYDMLKELKMLFAQQVEQELLQIVQEFYACKQEEGQSVSSYVLKMKSYIDSLERLRHAMTQKLAEGSRKTKRRNRISLLTGIRERKSKDGLCTCASFSPKPKNPTTPKKDNPAKDAIYHQCGEVGHWRRNCPIYLTELVKKKKLSQRASTSGIFTIELYSFPSTFWVYDTGCGTHICVTTQGLRGSRKLEPGALSMYVGNGHHATVKAIGEFHLCLSSGLVLILHNCHYAPSITRGIISVLRLYKDGFINCFEHDNTISVSKNNLVYFSTIPRDDIFEIDLSSSSTNDSVSKGSRNQLGKTIKSLRSDRRGEYISQEFLDHLKEQGIIAHRTLPYTPQHNGVSERRNRTLLGMVHSMMSQTTLPKSFWDYALESAARILNMVPTKKGCKALVKRDTLTKPNKMEPRSIKCIFVGYPKEMIGYSFYYPPENKFFVARNAEFLKNSLIAQEASGSLEDLEIIQEEDTHPSIDTSLNHKEDDQENDEPQSDINPIRRSTRTRRPTNRLCLYVDAEENELGDLGEPANYKAALLDPESDK
ncbi:retrotransposon protein, putative, ty1-copia subclass [Tanacetum coccineum]